MDYEKLKTALKEIVEVAETVPEPYRVKCFEMLLNLRLGNEAPTPPGQVTPPPPPGPGDTRLPIPAQLRLLMQRTELTEAEIQKVIMFADNDVHFIREPTGLKIAEGQIAWALLIALKNCILSNSLAVDPETVRSVCQDKGYYDKANFAAIFKRPQYAKLFKGAMEKQGQPQTLTNDGQIELAKLIRQMGTPA
jgi:hypothetical protein